MFECNIADIPSRGLFYPNAPAIVQVQKFGIPELMMLSSAIESDDDTLFVKAVQSATNIPDTLTQGDFYFFAAILRVLTFAKSPVVWEWTCTSDQLRLKFNLAEPELMTQDMQLLMSGHKFEQLDHFDFVKHDIDTKTLGLVTDYLMKNYDKQYSGVLGKCHTNNEQDITPELLVANAIYLPADFDLSVIEKGYEVPRVDTLPEYKKLYKDASYRKLLPMLACLDKSYGNTLKERLQTLRTDKNCTDILDAASKLDDLLTHGIRRELVSPACSVCSAHTDRQLYTATAESFFRK